MNKQQRHIAKAELGQMHNIIVNISILGNKMKIAATKKYGMQYTFKRKVCFSLTSIQCK